MKLMHNKRPLADVWRCDISKYGVYSTVMRDSTHLCAALTDMGFVFEGPFLEAQPLFGYRGDQRNELAHIIIRKEHTGLPASNDVGFFRQPDGTYQAVVSEYDRRQFNDTWIGKLKQSYAEHRQITTAMNRGYVFQGREVVQTAKGQSIKLRFSVR